MSVLLGHQGAGGSDFRFPLRTISRGNAGVVDIHAPTLFQAYPNWFWYYEDFLWDAFDADEMALSIYDHSPSGSPTKGLVANGTGGQFQLKASSTSEAQMLAICQDDNLFIQGNLPFMFAARVKVVHTMAANQNVLIGVTSAFKNDPVTPDYWTRHAMFKLDTDTDLLLESDDNTTDTDDKDTGIDITAGEWYWYVIENGSNGRLYYGLIDNEGYMKTWNLEDKFGVTAPSYGANNMQPFVGVLKASGTTTPEILCDAVLYGGQRVQ